MITKADLSLANSKMDKFCMWAFETIGGGKHGDLLRLLAGAKSAANQIEYVKKFGTSSPPPEEFPGENEFSVDSDGNAVINLEVESNNEIEVKEDVSSNAQIDTDSVVSVDSQLQENLSSNSQSEADTVVNVDAQLQETLTTTQSEADIDDSLVNAGETGDIAVDDSNVDNQAQNTFVDTSVDSVTKIDCE